MSTPYTPSCEYVASADGTRIYSEALGDPTKPCIVFIHGFQLSSVAFDPIFNDPKWTDQLYLIRYNTRGHGRSDKPIDDVFWTSNRLAEDFNAVIQKYNVVRPYVAGWSLGATHIADVLSFHSPSYLSGTININGTPLTGPLFADWITSVVHEYLDPLLQSTDVDAYQKGALHFLEVCAEDLPYYLRQRLLGDIVIQPRDVTKHLVTRHQDETGLLNAAYDPDLPKLLLLCEKDRLINNEGVRKYVENWKNCKTIVLPKADHTPWIGHPELFREAMLSWINEITRVL
ncbi:Alpha/Beta hydrolase protein [Amanita rubescens]|nr:Alpha/Beta hydrolase protein [Amanita rubescens]